MAPGRRVRVAPGHAGELAIRGTRLVNPASPGPCGHFEPSPPKHRLLSSKGSLFRLQRSHSLSGTHLSEFGSLATVR